MTGSNIQILFFIAFIGLSISLSLCQEPANDSLSGALKNEHEDLASYLQREGSLENIIANRLPNYKFEIKNNSLDIFPYHQDLSLYSGEPSYRLGIQSNNINDEDLFIIDIWIVGLGDVNASNINIRIPPKLVEGPMSVIRKDYYLSISRSPDNKTFRKSIRPILILNKTNETNIGLKIPMVNFYPATTEGDLNFMNYGATVVDENDMQKWLPTYPANLITMLPKGVNRQFYLYKIYFKVNRNAPPGDYSIKFDLFYKFGEKWYVDSQSLPLHVNYIYENENVQNLIISLASLGIFFQLDGLICRHPSLRNKKKRIFYKIRSLWAYLLHFLAQFSDRFQGTEK